MNAVWAQARLTVIECHLKVVIEQSKQAIFDCFAAHDKVGPPTLGNPDRKKKLEIARSLEPICVDLKSLHDALLKEQEVLREFLKKVSA